MLPHETYILTQKRPRLRHQHLRKNLVKLFHGRNLNVLMAVSTFPNRDVAQNHVVEATLRVRQCSLNDKHRFATLTTEVRSIHVLL